MRRFATLMLGTALLAVPGAAFAQMGPPAPPLDTPPPFLQTGPSGETLQQVLASVYRSNPRLLAERARLREIDENYIQARAQGRPQLSANAEGSQTWTRTETGSGFFGPGGSEYQNGNPYSGSVNLVQPIYSGGRVRALKRQAKASILAARASLENAENNIFLSAANAYVDVLRDEETARIRRNNVRVLDRQLVASNARFEVGEGTRTDIAQSRSRLAQSEAGLAQADAQLEVSRALFRRIVGRAPGPLAPAPDFALPATLEEATALAQANNPQLLAAYYNERAGEAAIDVARAAGRPTISLNGTLAGQRNQILGIGESDQAVIAARINVPLFSGGANKSRVRQAKHAKTRLAFETRDTERAVDQAMAEIWAQMQAARRIVQTAGQQVDAARIAFEGVTLEQQVGTRDQLDVLNAEQEVLNAELTLVNAERNLDSAVFQLLSVIGVMDADGIALPIETYDESAYLKNVSYDGLERAVDRYVPEAVQIIAPQVVNIVEEPVAAVGDVIDGISLDREGQSLGERLDIVGNVIKEGIDVVTRQDPAYDPRTNDPAVVIETDPYGDANPTPDVDEVIQLGVRDIPAPELGTQHGNPPRAPRAPDAPAEIKDEAPLPDDLQPYEGGR